MGTTKQRRKINKIARKYNAKRTTYTMLGWGMLTAVLAILGIVLGNFFFGGSKNPLRGDGTEKTVLISHKATELLEKKPTSSAETRDTPAKYNFYEDLKKRSDEVQIEVENRIKEEQKNPVKGRNYRIQIGAFRDESSADKLRARMILRDYPVSIVRNGDIRLVQVGPYVERDEAVKVQHRLEREGLETVLKAYVN